MPSREDLRKSGRNRRVIWIVAGCVLVLLIVVVAFLLTRKPTDESNVDKFGSSVKSSSSVTSKSSSDTSSAPKKRISNDSVVGMGFQMAPVEYNGEDVDAAMNANRAPQNAVHDNIVLGYFKSGSVARICGAPMYFYVHSVPYSVSGQRLHVDNKVIPLQIKDGEFQAVRFKQTDRDGNVWTYEFKAMSDAKQNVESHVQPADSDSQDDASSTSGAVDQKNLTSAQKEHWVRSYIKSVSQVYNPKEYTVTQKFVDGYAEVSTFYRLNGTGKSSLAGTYRVNGDGYLEMQTDSGTWRVIDKVYR